MKKSFFYSFVLFIVGVFVMIACQKEKVDIQKQAKIETQNLTGTGTDPCASINTGNCAGIPYTTVYDQQIHLDEYPDCTFYVTYKFRVCNNSMDVKIISYTDWPFCEAWRDKIFTLPSGDIAQFFIDFERSLITHIIPIEIVNAGIILPTCGNLASSVFSTAYHHSSCSKRCAKILENGALQVFEFWCGNGCCQSNFTTCINSLGKVISIYLGSSPTTGCSITWEPACQEGWSEYMPCSATCDF